jgi:hypothetical protein
MKLKQLSLLFVIVLLFSCGSKDNNSRGIRNSKEVIMEMSSNQFAPPPLSENITVLENAAPDQYKSESLVTKKKIIKDGSISIETQDITSSKKSFDEIVKKFNAYYETEELHNNERTTSFDLKLRIPADIQRNSITSYHSK